MPVQIVDEEDLLVSKFKRLSATSLIQYRNCPRSWYHQRIEFLRGPQVPAMMRGHIVENTVSRVFRETPLLVSESDAWDVLETPLDDQQRPSRDSTAGYKAPSIQRREGLDSIESLRTWAQARCDIHLPVVKQIHVEEFEDNPMSIGSGADLDDEALEYAQQNCPGVEFRNEDSRQVLLSSGWQWVDIDPFGSPVPFLDSAMQSSARRAVMEITATDTAALTGSSARACLRRYGAKIRTDQMAHDSALRLLMATVARTAATHDRCIIPLLSSFQSRSAYHFRSRLLLSAVSAREIFRIAVTYMSSST